MALRMRASGTCMSPGSVISNGSTTSKPPARYKGTPGMVAANSIVVKPAVAACCWQCCISVRPSPWRAIDGSTKKARMRAACVAGSSSGSGPVLARSLPNSVARLLQPQHAATLDQEVGLVGDQLRVDTEYVLGHGRRLRFGVKAGTEFNAGTGDQRLHVGDVGGLRQPQLRLGAEDKPRLGDAPILDLIHRHQLDAARTFGRRTADDFVIDHHVANRDAFDQSRMRPGRREA